MRVITGMAGGIKLKTPEGLDTRPTAERVKEALFSAIQFELEGRAVLDLFAGSGQLGIEALSRGASSAVFVDKNPTAVRFIRDNLQKTKFKEKSAVLQTDYQTYLRTTGEKFDIIFLDPPYAENFLEISLNIISEIDILKESGIIVCEKPSEKELEGKIGCLSRKKAYKYGKVSLVLYRKE